MQTLTWQSSIPQYAQFNTQIENYRHLHTIDAYQLQPRLVNALTRFLNTSYPHFLLLCTTDVQEQYLLLKEKIQTLSPDRPIIHTQCFDEYSLFGAVYVDIKNSQLVQPIEGLLHQANDGILILSLAQLLTQVKIWQRLKNTIISQKLHWKAAKSDEYCQLPAPTSCKIHLILIGDREQISLLEEVDPDLHKLSLFAEYEQDLHLTEANINDYLSLIKNFQQRFNVKPLSTDTILPLMQAGARFTEDHNHLPLCPLWFHSILTEAHYQAKNEQIEQTDLKTAIAEKYCRAAYLPERSLDDIHQGQVLIDTQGEKIGQANGLAMLEIAGHPLAYGEPTRISCVVHFGEGDITDVERKAELGGSLHAKGMMILQAFIYSALELKEDFPFCASIAFEQSYYEVDGDSATLAKLCAFISALSIQPIKQSIAITGSVDQFGRVQAVGGINEKIEGFFAVCAERGLTGEQGVILPKTNINALCLKPEIVEAIKVQQFHLWPVENAEEALFLLTKLPFRAQEADGESLLNKITERIDLHHQELHSYSSLWSRCKNAILRMRR